MELTVRLWVIVARNFLNTKPVLLCMRIHQKTMTHSVSLYSDWTGRDLSRTTANDLDTFLFESNISQSVSIDVYWKDDLFEFNSRHRLAWFSEFLSLLHLLR
jgi:hypothetical protein